MKYRINIKVLFSTFVLILIVIGLSFFYVPRLPPLSMKKLEVVSLVELQRVLEENESLVHPKLDTEKKIIFFRNLKKQTPLSFLYLHGFSATRKEISPVFETVSEHFQSHLFLTRLRGHGLGAEELGQATKEQWLEDAIEGLDMAEHLGRKVVVGCVSTGCALALYLARYFPQNIKAMIFLSPNFSPADSRAFFANGPFGPHVTRLVLGPYRDIKPINDANAYYWTTRYGSRVIPEMVSLVAAAKNLDLENIKVPILTLYSPFDEVISVREIEKTVPRLGGPANKAVILHETREHLIAGDIFNPVMNSRVILLIENFLQNTL